MIVADVVRFLTLATVPIAAMIGLVRMPQLYAVALIGGTASVFFAIAYKSYLPVLVPADRLTDANVTELIIINH